MKIRYLLQLLLVGGFGLPVWGGTVLPDSLDNPSSFWELNRRATQEARRRMPWGMSVPENEWRNFVEPVRVNNEKLDSSRVVFFRELAPRLAGMSMTEAALEVNHWCHEKVTYRPSDPRTSSPLSTVLTSWGRCGEESTFTVAAMRSVGIPARQVYTPRWAHCDNNHAWVEVWTDGEWHFLGACEPEAVLDLGWFNAPASRGILMSASVRNGAYDGPEEVLERNDNTTVLNVTQHYAPVRKACVRVVNADGTPAAGATVIFMIYNYGEFYPAVRQNCDVDGKASLTVGKGDLFVWAVDSATGKFGYARNCGNAGDEVSEIVLDKDSSMAFSFDVDIVPPPQSDNVPLVSAEQEALNKRRLVYEDSVRNAYMDTFISLDEGRKFAEEHHLPRPESVAALLRDSYGNHPVIGSFLTAAPDKEKAVALLEVLSDKDLRDVTAEVLHDHYSTEGSGPLFNRYVMNPRVAFEPLTPYKSQLAGAFSADSAALLRDAPEKLVEWVRANIAVSEAHNPDRLYISPASVLRHRRDIDARSRNVFFVCMARTLGIPSRIDQVTGKAEWATADGAWHEARFEAESPAAPKGAVRLVYDGTGLIDTPAYYMHFTLSRIDGGLPVLLEFDEEGNFNINHFSGSEGYPLDEGQYMLVSGQRLADGTVLAHADVFSVEEGKVTEVPLIMRSDAGDMPTVTGTFDSENLYIPANSTTPASILSATGRGYYVLGVIKPSHEPSSHTINDIRARAAEVERWPVKIMLLAESPEALAAFRPEQFEGLPSNVIVGAATAGIVDELSAHTMPVFIIADTFNRVVFRSEGYTVNMPEVLASVLRKL